MDCLDILQKINNVMYSLFGFNDCVLEVQVYINSKRAQKNKRDKKEVVYIDKYGEYVQ